MSIILEALKKADSQRQLGELPGLHTPSPRLQTAALHRGGPLRIGRFWLFVLVVCGASVALVGWYLMRTDAQPAVLVRPATPAAPVVITSPVAPIAPTVPLVVAELPVPPPIPRPSVKSTALTPAVGQPVKTAAGQTAVLNSTPATTPTPTEERVLALAELPTSVQQELPPMVVGGSMYSNAPADRMLLIDKRLLHEGEEVAPGVLLEKLQPRSAILRYKNYRFRLAY